MKKQSKPCILVVDDQPEILNAIERLFKSDYTVLKAENGDSALSFLKKYEIAVILSDQRMPGMSGVEFLEQALTIQPEAIRILITAYADLEVSIDAVNRGQIYYYVSKPWEPDELTLLVKRSMERFDLVKSNQRLKAELQAANERLKSENITLRQSVHHETDFSNMVGHAPRMLEVFKLVSKVINTPTTVLLLGETGTGKEMMAKAIHYNSDRKERLFVAQNCGALPDTLLESELFGHARGAFTGAVSDKKGIFEQANGGTIFLDEIGDTSPAMQQRMLRVVQEGEIRPVGAQKSMHVDVRIIAATNKDLEAEVSAGRFREDLYFRLCVFPVHLPPLRERVTDIPDLTALFIGRYAARIHKKINGIHQDALQMLCRAPFPGNIRELENEIERAVTLADDGGQILPEYLSARFHQQLPARIQPADSSSPLKDQVESLEKQLILQALQQTGGNILQAAKKLSISRVGLHKKLTRYGIDAHGV